MKLLAHITDLCCHIQAGGSHSFVVRSRGHSELKTLDRSDDGSVGHVDLDHTVVYDALSRRAGMDTKIHLCCYNSGEWLACL
jgi:hypothetical protein